MYSGVLLKPFAVVQKTWFSRTNHCIPGYGDEPEFSFSTLTMALEQLLYSLHALNENLE